MYVEWCVGRAYFELILTESMNLLEPSFLLARPARSYFYPKQTQTWPETLWYVCELW